MYPQALDELNASVSAIEGIEPFESEEARSAPSSKFGCVVSALERIGSLLRRGNILGVSKRVERHTVVRRSSRPGLQF